MKKYEKPVLQLKVVAASKSIAAGLDGWLEGNGLTEANITSVELYATES